MSAFDEWYTDEKAEYLFFSDRDELALHSFNAGLEAAATLIEQKERSRWEHIGDPRIKEFTPWWAIEVRKLKED